MARNFVGKYSASTALSVATKPRIVSSAGKEDQFGKSVVKAEIGSVIRASPGSSIRISCPAEGNKFCSRFCRSFVVELTLYAPKSEMHSWLQAL